MDSAEITNGVDAPTLAACYAQDGHVYPRYTTSHAGASMAIMTASDLVRFGLAHTGASAFLSEPMKEMMIAPAETGQPWKYGLGWQIWREGTDLVFGHSGGMPGVSSLLKIVPDCHLAAAIVANQSESDLPRRTWEMIRRLVLGHEPPPAAPVAPNQAPAAVASGRWGGVITTHEGPVSVQLELRSPAVAKVSVDGSAAEAAATTYSENTLLKADLVVRVPVQIPTSDARRRSGHTELILYHTGGGMVGIAAACPGTLEGAGGTRDGNYYGHSCSLEAARKGGQVPSRT
jgi:hypothetical protein